MGRLEHFQSFDKSKSWVREFPANNRFVHHKVTRPGRIHDDAPAFRILARVCRSADDRPRRRVV